MHPKERFVSMPPKSNLQVHVDASFQALENAPLEKHWNVMKSANTDIPTLMMPSDGVVKAEDLIKHPNYTMLCPAINTSPSRILTFNCISKALEHFGKHLPLLLNPRWCDWRPVAMVCNLPVDLAAGGLVQNRRMMLAQVPVLLQYHVDPEQEQLPEQEQPDEPYDAAWDEQLYDELYDADWDEQLYAIHCHPPYSDFLGEDYAWFSSPDN